MKKSLNLTRLMNLFLGNKENNNINEMLKVPEKTEIDKKKKKIKIY